MAYVELLKRIVATSQSKFRIEAKNITQQNSYNLDLQTMSVLKNKKAITEISKNNYVVTNDYSVVLGDGILKLIGNSYANSKANVVFSYTESNNKFQIKRTENTMDEYKWFSVLYDKNYEGSSFLVFLDEDNKKIKFDSIPPYNLDESIIELVTEEEYCSMEKLSNSLLEYCKKFENVTDGIVLFGEKYSVVLEKNQINLNELLDINNLSEYLVNLKCGISIGNYLKNIQKAKNTTKITTSIDKKGNAIVGYNKIFYGIPGCGKSYHVENVELNGVDKENDVIRTTFYLDYANSDFIGQLYPHVDDEGHVTYTHIPGPFTEALERAFNNKDKMIYLVIEEINRGNAAAIFGDVFQLLDRLKEDRDGRHVGDSEYPVSNAFIEDYFKKNNVEFTPGQIYIPRNLTIFATMNTSDQNVFPLDTAFKRRWDREMVTADWDKVSFRNKFVPCTNITWEKFATVINKEILKQNDDSDVSISEDKQIGAFFVRESMLSDVEKEGTRDQLIPFVTNVIDYLYNDVTKFDHKILFRKDITSYDSLYEKMETYIRSYDKNTNDFGCGPLELLFNDDLIEILKNSEDE